MVVHYYFEEGKEGGWNCIIRERFESIFRIEGHGDTKELALEDMNRNYQIAVDYACDNDLPCPDLDFLEEVEYDESAIKKNWYVTTLGTFFNDRPKDEEEDKYFKEVMAEAKRHGAKVKEVWLNKTDEEFYNRHYQEQPFTSHLQKTYKIRFQYKGQVLGSWSGPYNIDEINDYKQHGLKQDLLRCDYIEVYEEGKPEAIERINNE